VVLAGGEVLPATIASSDPHTGIVLLQVSSSGLPPPLGFSSTPALGSTAIAISVSLGGSMSVDVGTVSELGITASVSDPTAAGGSTTWDGMMRTGVAEPPGSSGAPLVNSTGQVVGILAGSRMVPLGQASGYFALDAVEAAYLVSAISSNGAGPPPVGLVTEYLTPATAAALQLPAGAEVLSVDPGSAAAEAGLKVGDVVVELDGSAVQGSGAPKYPDLADLLTTLGPGAQVALSVQEGVQRRSLTLTVPAG
jgi:S1-C subfamily serine protease